MSERYGWSDDEGFFVDMAKLDEDGLGEEMTNLNVVERLNAQDERIRLLERAVREACWHAVEGDNDLFCYFCEGRIKDGRPQDEWNVAHESACPVIVGFESNPAPDGAGEASHDLYAAGAADYVPGAIHIMDRSLVRADELFRGSKPGRKSRRP